MSGPAEHRAGNGRRRRRREDGTATGAPRRATRRPGRRRLARWLAGLALVATGLVAVSGCASLDKDELRAALLALPGNAPLAPALGERVVGLTLADGARRAVPITWLRLPRPGAPRVLLLHGTPGTLLNWSPVLAPAGRDGAPGSGGAPGPSLADHFDVTAIELPGHGMSRDGLEPRTFAACADVLGAALDALALGPTIVVAQSYGGEVAWRMALDRPDLVEALVLVDSSGLPRRDDEWLPEEEAMRELPGAGFGWLLNARDRVAAALRPHFRDGIPGDLLEETYLVCENATNWRTMVGLARDENGTRSPELSELTMPTLLIWGEHDLAYPPERFAERFRSLVPAAELVVLPDTGHYPPQERPGAFVELLRQRFGR